MVWNRPRSRVYLSRQNNENNGRIVFAARLTWDPQGIQESCKSTGKNMTSANMV